jgi:hypothetical protein
MIDSINSEISATKGGDAGKASGDAGSHAALLQCCTERHQFADGTTAQKSVGVTSEDAQLALANKAADALEKGDFSIYFSATHNMTHDQGVEFASEVAAANQAHLAKDPGVTKLEPDHTDTGYGIGFRKLGDSDAKYAVPVE